MYARNPRPLVTESDPHPCTQPVPGGEAVFAAISLLLKVWHTTFHGIWVVHNSTPQATGGIDDRLDAILELLDDFDIYLRLLRECEDRLVPEHLERVKSRIIEEYLYVLQIAEKAVKESWTSEPPVKCCIIHYC